MQTAPKKWKRERAKRETGLNSSVRRRPNGLENRQPKHWMRSVRNPMFTIRNLFRNALQSANTFGSDWVGANDVSFKV